jgi:hypothetical protein
MEKSAYTTPKTNSSYYEKPIDCDIILSVKIECYDMWESLPFINIYNRDKKLMGFSLHEIFNNNEGNLMIIYK